MEVLFIVVLLGLTCMTATAQACPQDTAGLQWANDRNVTCTALLPYAGQASSLVCSSSALGLGPRASSTVLTSQSHASALAALLPAGGKAWVALAVSGGAWAWPAGSSSTYALSSGTAWTGGAVPPATAGLCAVVTGPAGLLQAVPCAADEATLLGTAHACSIPACAAGSTSVASPSWSGYDCAPAATTSVVRSWAIVHGSEPGVEGGRVPPGLSAAVGCGTVLAPGTALPELSYIPGDILRLCGTFPGWTNTSAALPSLRLLAQGNVTALGHASQACNDPGQQCYDFAFPGKAASSYGLGQRVSVGYSHACALVPAPAGTVRCWGTPLAAVAVPLDLPPVVSVHAGNRTTCVILAGSGGVSCWGEAGVLPPVPPGLANIQDVGIGERHACALSGEGKVVCWSTGPEAVNTTAVPADLPPARAMAVGQSHTCVLVSLPEGYDDVRCWGLHEPYPYSTPLQRDKPWEPIFSITAGGSRTCAVLGASGETCWPWLGPNSDGTGDYLAPTGNTRMMGVDDRFYCALVGQGGSTMHCYNLPNGRDVPSRPLLAPVPDVQSVSVGAWGVCAVMVGGPGEVRCWTMGVLNDTGALVPMTSALALTTATVAGSISAFTGISTASLSLLPTATLRVHDTSWSHPYDLWANDTLRLALVRNGTLDRGTVWRGDSTLQLTVHYMYGLRHIRPHLFVHAQQTYSTALLYGHCTAEQVVSAYALHCFSHHPAFGIIVYLPTGDGYDMLIYSGGRRPFGWHPCPVELPEAGAWEHTALGVDGQGYCTHVAGQSTWVNSLSVLHSGQTVQDTCSGAQGGKFGMLSPGPAIFGSIWSSAHAASIAARLGSMPDQPNGAIVGLVASLNASQALEWSWLTDSPEGGKNTYGLMDGSAWVGGAVPVPSGVDNCVVLLRDGLLLPFDCTASDQLAVALRLPAVVSLPSCPCQLRPGPLEVSDVEAVCYTATRKEGYNGYDCTPIAQNLRVWGTHVWRASEVGITQTVTDGVGARTECTRLGSTTEEVDAALFNLKMYPGDVFRLCGYFTVWRIDINPNAVPTLVPIESGMKMAGRVCTGRNTSATCVEYRMPAAFAEASAPGIRFVHGYAHIFVIERIPEGAVRCFVANNLGATDVPADLPPAASLAASAACTCAIAAVTGSVRCWGGFFLDSVAPFAVRIAPVGNRFVAFGCGQEVPTDVARVQSVSVGPLHACSVQRGTGAVHCWSALFWSEETGVPDDLPPVASVSAGFGHTCAVLRGSGKVRCWALGYRFNDMWSLDIGVRCRGECYVPADLPPAASVAAGDRVTFALLAGTGQVVYWSVTPGEEGPYQTVATPNPAAAMAAHGSIVCIRDAGTTDGIRCADFSSVDPVVEVPAPLKQMLFPDARGTVLPALLYDVVRPYYIPLAFVAAAKVAFYPLITRVIEPPASGRQSYVEMSGWLTSDSGGQGGTTMNPFRMKAEPSAPSFLIYVQETADSLPSKTYCPALIPLSLTDWRCYGFMYGVDVRYWTELVGLQRILQDSQSPALQQSINRPIQLSPEPPLNISSISSALYTALRISDPSPGRVHGVWAGDTVEIRGAGFGLHARLVQEVPWWRPPATNTTVLRSCIHLVWWANPAAYHDNDACVCNGQEDWLGEGEVPLRNIISWNDTAIRFEAPDVEGIREVRLCVEGFGGSRPSRSRLSDFLVWVPPRIRSVEPGVLIDNTDEDTAVRLIVAYTGFYPALRNVTWGHCPLSNDSDTAESSTQPGRILLRQPLPADQSFAGLRYCLAQTILRTSLGQCYMHPSGMNSTLLFTPAAAGAWQSHVGTDCRPSLFGSPDEQLSATWQANVLLVPAPEPLHIASLALTYNMYVWDGGVIVSGSDRRSLTVRRIEPAIRSVSPNPLLLGPNGTATRPAILTLFGEGFRTAEEVMDPRSGLAGMSPNVTVLIDGVPCTDATAVRSLESRSAYVTCIYPADVLGGDKHDIELTMLGVTTRISAADSTRAPLVTACAPGFFGLFGVPGHQQCLPCEPGWRCDGGVGRAPIAEEGFYNLGLPPRSNTTGVSIDVRTDRLTNVTTLSGKPCLPALTTRTGGRDVGCILSCEPREACIGDNQCAEGYMSVPPEYRCAQCAPNYYRSSGYCVQCPDQGRTAIALVVAGILVILCAMFLLSTNSMRLCTLNVVLEYVQVVSLLQGPNIPWPGAVKEVLYRLAIMRLDISVAAPECYTSIALTPESRLWIVLVMPLIVLLGSFVVYLAAGVTKKLLLRSHMVRETVRSREQATSMGLWLVATFFQGSIWSHGPSVCRNMLKLLGALYLPVVSASLQVWNCLPTDPPDGRVYLQIVFEPCGVPGGLQERMIPWATAGLLLYGAMYPVALAWFFFAYQNQIVEDQLLIAEGSGEDRKTNPRAYTLRTYFAPLYEDFRPGYHYAALISHARKVLVCICALFLNRDEILLAAAVVFVVTVALTAQAILQPYMTPGAGYTVALAQFGGRLQVGRSEADLLMQRKLAEIAATTRVRPLMELAAGHTVCSDVEGASRPWWWPVVDWNILEAELQLQVVLIGLLSVMYNAAAASTVYSEQAVPAVTAMFFLLLAVAGAHIAVTVGYDFVVQLRKTMAQLLGHGTAQQAAHGHDADGEKGGNDFSPRTEMEQASEPPHLDVPLLSMLTLCFCRCLYSRAQARAAVFGLHSGGSAEGGLGGGESSSSSSSHRGPAMWAMSRRNMLVSEWTNNPLSQKGEPVPLPPCRTVYAPTGMSGASSSSSSHARHAPSAPAQPQPQPRQGHTHMKPAHTTSSTSTDTASGINPLHAHEPVFDPIPSAPTTGSAVSLGSRRPGLALPIMGVGGIGGPSPGLGLVTGLALDLQASPRETQSLPSSAPASARLEDPDWKPLGPRTPSLVTGGTLGPAASVRSPAASVSGASDTHTNRWLEEPSILEINPMHILKAAAQAQPVAGPRAPTLRRARVGARASLRLSAIQKASRFVQVGIEEVTVLVDLPSLEDWRLIRSSFIALWELVEFEQGAGDLTRKQVRELQGKVAELQAQMERLTGQSARDLTLAEVRGVG